MFDKVDGFFRDNNGTKYFGSEKYSAIFNRIRYLISLRSSISYLVSHNYGKIKINSDDGLLLEKNLTLDNVILLIKSVFNKNYNQYYYKTFLEKYSYPVAN